MIATKSPIEYLLRKWGHYYGERAPKEWDEAGEDESQLTGSHPIARAMEFSGGDGHSLGRHARGMAKLRGTPTWGFDPVTCSETRSRRISVPEDVPRDVQLVQSAALELYRFDTLRGTVLRFEYCKRGSQSEKTAMLVTAGLSVSLRVYRESLSYARGWMESRLRMFPVGEEELKRGGFVS